MVLRFLLVLFLLSLSAAPALAAPKYKIRWLVAHGPYNLIEEATHKFADQVKSESNGEIEVEVVIPGGFHDGLSSPSVALNSLAKGEFEMSQIYTTQIGGVDHRLWVLDLPFLFRSHEHASAVLDGPIGRELLNGMAEGKRNFRGLAFTYSGGYRLTATREKPIQKLEDFRGQRLSPMGASPVFRATMKRLGAVPLFVDKRDLYQHLLDKKLDGFDTTYTRFGDLKESRFTGHLSETFHSLHLTSILVNEKFFRSLPPGYQQLLRRAAQAAALTERAVSIRAAEDYRENRIKPSNVKVITVSDAERERMQAAVAGVEKHLTQFFPASLVDRIRKQK